MLGYPVLHVGWLSDLAVAATRFSKPQQVAVRLSSAAAAASTSSPSPTDWEGRDAGRDSKDIFRGRFFGATQRHIRPLPPSSRNISLIIVFTTEKQHVKDAASSPFSSSLPLQQGPHPALLPQEADADARVQGPPLQPRPLRHQEVAGNAAACPTRRFSCLVSWKRILDQSSFFDGNGYAMAAGRRGPGGAAGRGDPGAQGEECGGRQQVWPSQDRQRWGDGPQGGTAVHEIQ